MKKWIISACLLMMQAGAWAKVTLPDIMSDNMVLQQQTEACLWGKANANAEVTTVRRGIVKHTRLLPVQTESGLQRLRLLRQVTTLTPFLFPTVKKSF